MSDQRESQEYPDSREGVESPSGEAREHGTEMAKDLFSELNGALDDSVKARIIELRELAVEREYPPFAEYPLAGIEADIEKVVAEAGYDAGILRLGPPTAKKNQDIAGIDLAFNAAGLAKRADRNPVEAAEELASQIGERDYVAEVTTVGPFVNITLDYERLAPAVVESIQSGQENYGRFTEGEGKPRLVLVDYSSPNIAKNMTVAHLRSTIIGESLATIHEAGGDTAVRVNHIGDWGTQFGKIIYQYRAELETHGDAFQTRLDEDPAAVLLEIYRKFNEEKKDDLEANQEAQEIFLALEQGDPELVALWDQFKKWSMADFAPVYERLQVEFDAIQGESFYEDRMAEVVEEGLASGVLRRNEEGAVVFPAQTLVDRVTGKENSSVMEDQNGDPRDEIILKPSGGTVYLTRDLAAIKYRAQELGVDKILYVIGKEQQGHCLMLFNMAEQLGYIKPGQAEHISFGHLNVDGRKMKSREGKVVLLDELLTEATAQAANLIAERRDGAKTRADDETRTAEQIGVGSVIFNDLSQDRRMDIEFNPDSAASVESGRLPYIQYTHARLCSVERRLPETFEAEPDYAALSDVEKGIVFKLASYPAVVRRAAQHNLPHHVASYLTELCQDLNYFYQSHSVLKAEGSEQATRAAIISTARQVIQNATGLLHVEVPERM